MNAGFMSLTNIEGIWSMQGWGIPQEPGVYYTGIAIIGIEFGALY